MPLYFFVAEAYRLWSPWNGMRTVVVL